MSISSSAATFEGLFMNDNIASGEGPDMFDNSGTDITCIGSTCTAGQYSEQCDLALVNTQLQCPINCDVSPPRTSSLSTQTHQPAI